MLDIVSQAAGAELTEVSQVFAELSWLHAGSGGQGVAGNGADGVGFEAVEATQVKGEAIDRLAGNLWADGFFQTDGKLSNESAGKQEWAGEPARSKVALS